MEHCVNGMMSLSLAHPSRLYVYEVAILTCQSIKLARQLYSFLCMCLDRTWHDKESKESMAVGGGRWAVSIGFWLCEKKRGTKAGKEDTCAYNIGM